MPQHRLHGGSISTQWPIFNQRCAAHPLSSGLTSSARRWRLASSSSVARRFIHPVDFIKVACAGPDPLDGGQIRGWLDLVGLRQPAVQWPRSGGRLHLGGRLLIGFNDDNIMAARSRSTRWWSESGRCMTGSDKPVSWQQHHAKISARRHLFSC
jgi:hypothetical protein